MIAMMSLQLIPHSTTVVPKMVKSAHVGSDAVCGGSSSRPLSLKALPLLLLLLLFLCALLLSSSASTSADPSYSLLIAAIGVAAAE